MIKDLDKKECIKLLSENYLGHLAYIFQKRSIVVPITFHYDKSSNSLILYSGETQKINAMRKNNLVSFEVEDILAVNNWKSVLVEGEFEELQGCDAKYFSHKFALGVKKNIAAKGEKEVKFINEFSAKTNEAALPVVFRINIQETTGKQRTP